MRRVNTLLAKLEKYRDEPDAVNFEKEIQNFSYDELRELAQRMAQRCGVASHGTRSKPATLSPADLGKPADS
jgi:hypothetical protein